MNEKMKEFKELITECHAKKGVECLELFRIRRKRMWELAGYFDFFGLKGRAQKSLTLIKEDMTLVSYLASLVCLESLARKLESSYVADTDHLMN